MISAMLKNKEFTVESPLNDNREEGLDERLSRNSLDRRNVSYIALVEGVRRRSLLL